MGTCNMLVAMYVLLFALPAITSSCFRPPPPRPTTTTIKPPGDCKCGVARGSNSRKTRGRIVGGEDAKKNEFPWQVALSMSSSAGSLFCGGSLLSSNTVLTAAHCINAGVRYVIHSDHNKDLNDGEQTVRVKSTVKHPKYDARTADYDLAVVTLDQPVTFSDKVYPICLPDFGTDFSGKIATATGWGTLSSNGARPNILQKVNVRIMSNAQCTNANTIYTSSDITSRMLCAASPGKDTCQGDSGGPLIVRNSQNFFEQAGITSWGLGCADASAPGVYARVSEEVAWIKSKIQGTICPKP